MTDARADAGGLDAAATFQREVYERHYADRAALAHAQAAHPLFADFYDRLAARVLDARDASAEGAVRVVELGAGEGLLAAALHRVAARRGVDLDYVGSDLSDAGVRLAAEVAGGGRWVVGDAREVPLLLPPASADLVVAKNLLHHLPDPAPALGAGARLLAPGGRIVAAEASRGSGQAWLFSLLAPRRERWFFTSGPRRNIAAFQRAGLRLRAVEPFSWLPYELLFAVRYAWPRRVLGFGDPALLRRVADVDDVLARRLQLLASYLLWVADRLATPR